MILSILLIAHTHYGKCGQGIYAVFVV